MPVQQLPPGAMSMFFYRAGNLRQKLVKQVYITLLQFWLIFFDEVQSKINHLNLWAIGNQIATGIDIAGVNLKMWVNWVRYISYAAPDQACCALRFTNAVPVDQSSPSTSRWHSTMQKDRMATKAELLECLWMQTRVWASLVRWYPPLLQPVR